MRMILWSVLLFAGCAASQAREVDRAAIDVAIADALMEVRTPPELPNDFAVELSPAPLPAPERKRPGEVSRGEPLAQVEPVPESPPAKEYLPRLVIYTAPEWCAPCQRLAQEIERLKGLEVGGKKVWRGQVGPGPMQAVQVLDASCDPSPELEQAQAAGVKEWPTIIRLDADGQEQWRFSGTMTAEQLSRAQAGTYDPTKGAAKTNAASDGVHAHRCPSCATVWSHSPGTITDHEEAHRCPQCGTLQHEVYSPNARDPPVGPVPQLKQWSYQSSWSRVRQRR